MYYDEIEQHYLSVLQRNPNDAEAHNNYANLLYTVRKRYDEAEKHYKEALRLNPELSIAHYNYARFLITVRNDLEKAKTHCRTLRALKFGNQPGLDRLIQRLGLHDDHAVVQ